ncbi:hypothetical protein LTR37_011244 [Vermiconidia calcicola]|uniref:Uncharacterized protein n=1 Tax=Vermiconidia calcicola TaxID=1690605 RepID=A0ACC3N2X2_9PEZI|nr:hypothetical protein LTR37_011244 [Vermiconidia calcicola]
MAARANFDATSPILVISTENHLDPVSIHLDLLQKVVPNVDWSYEQKHAEDNLVCLDTSETGLKYFTQWVYSGDLLDFIPRNSEQWNSKFIELTCAYDVAEWMKCVDFQDTVADAMVTLFADHLSFGVPDLSLDYYDLHFIGRQLLVDLVVYGPASCLKDAKGQHLDYETLLSYDDDIIIELASEILKSQGHEWQKAVESEKLSIMLVCGFVEAEIHPDSCEPGSESWAQSTCISMRTQSSGCLATRQRSEGFQASRLPGFQAAYMFCVRGGPRRTCHRAEEYLSAASQLAQSWIQRRFLPSMKYEQLW